MWPLLFTMLLTFADSTQAYYGRMDAPGLQHLCATPANVEADLLCRYRLYPLTQDERYLANLPAALPDASARSLALLSGLWGYRAAQAPLPRLITYGTRATRLMEQAQALDPADPFVLLIAGQSLLFRPRLVGGDTRAALAYFERLARVLPRTPHVGIAQIEADLWVWYALHRLAATSADARRRELLARRPPPLYRRFLEDPL